MIPQVLQDRGVREGTGECWLWTSSVDKYGYGRLNDRALPTRPMSAHRWVFELLVGDIPAEMTVDHICFVKQCVNPAHLQLLTRVENSRRQRRALAHECARGHRFTPENTGWNQFASGPRRYCRECHRAARARRARTYVLADPGP